MTEATGSQAGLPARYWTIFGIALSLACLVNGAYPYLARVGLIERANYDRYVSAYCQMPRPVHFPTATCSCIRDPGPLTTGGYRSWEYLYQADGYRLVPKLAKDALFLTLLLSPLLLFRQPWKDARIPPWPLLAMALITLAGFAVSVPVSGWLFATLSMRTFEFLVIALVAGWLARGLPEISRWLAWLLVVEFVLVAVELVSGMPTRSCPNSFRVAGTMVLPNTFGVVVAASLAFIYAFSIANRHKAMLSVIAVLMLLASGSGTGFVMLAALAAWIAFERLPRRHVIWGAATTALVGVLLAWFLPALTNRPDIYDSLFAKGGRVEQLLGVVSENDFLANMVGRGLGVGANQTSILAVLKPSLQTALQGTAPFYADSTVTSLLMQLGLVGLVAFYAMLCWAFVRDRVARPFYLVVAIASLAISIPEAFPLNFLFGLALAHTLMRVRGSEAGLP